MQISGYSWDQVIDAHPSGAVGQREQLPAALSRTARSSCARE